MPSGYCDECGGKQHSGHTSWCVRGACASQNKTITELKSRIASLEYELAEQASAMLIVSGEKKMLESQLAESKLAAVVPENVRRAVARQLLRPMVIHSNMEARDVYTICDFVRSLPGGKEGEK